MIAARSLIAFMGFILGAPQPVVDLTKIDRAIGKEPEYQSKPRYCLLVFGPEARTRIWLVIDGKVLYVDRDGNGDLTGSDERVVGKDGVFRVGELKDVATGTTHKEVTVSVDRPVEGTSEVRPFEVNARIRGKYLCFVIADPGDRPGAAPVVHLDGPLRVRLFNEGLAFEHDKDARLSIYFVTVGQNGCTYAEIDGVPTNVHPLAVIEFPAKDPKAKPMVLKVPLKERC